MLSRKAKYALKAMLRLAQAESHEHVQAADIAQQDNIPKSFLNLILFELRTNGLVKSVRGKEGGYALSAPPDTITIGQIIRVVDGPLAPIACASINFYERCDDCPDERGCAVRLLMRKVRDATSTILDHTTLSDAAASAMARESRAKPPAPPRRRVKSG